MRAHSPRAPRAPAITVTLALILALILALGFAVASVEAAAAADAPRDTLQSPAGIDSTIGGYLDTLSDSTDRYFGITAAPLDTAGLDSALAYGIAHPGASPRTRARLQLGWAPWFQFNRVDGFLWGGGASLGRPAALGALGGRLGWAAGPDEWQGGGEYRRALRRRDALWSLRLFAGRMTAGMDRDHEELLLGSLRALFVGNDRQRYYRRDGFEGTLARETRTLRIAAGYRDQLESPRAVTATWTLFGGEPEVLDNLAAARGRALEATYDASFRWPWLPLQTDASYQTSGHRIGSDFEYRRTRLATGGNFGLGHWGSLVPQLLYGRLSGEPLPQAAFYFGGRHSLRSLADESLGGTGVALARADFVGAPDLLALLRVRHPAAFPVQGGVFAASGAVWGGDPYGGPTGPGVDWPQRSAWLSEAGVSLLWRPGLPDPTGFVRLSHAWPLGPGGRERRWSIAYTRALDLLTPFER